MVILLTEAALNKIKEKIFTEKHSPRIDADITGGCGMSVKFSLIFDELRRNDTVIEHEGIQIRINRFTKRYLDEEIQIDYSDEHGFLIGDSFVSGSCALEVV